MNIVIPVLQSTLIVPLTLLPIINPLGNVPIFNALSGGRDVVARGMARQVAFNAWVILMVSMLIGSYVLDVFGISLAIVQLGGGMLVATTGWRLLQTDEDDAVRTAVADQAAELSAVELAKRSFFPMSFPLTAGPGSIATAIALGTTTSSGSYAYITGVAVALIGTAITAGAVYLCYRYGTLLLKRLGDIGEIVMMRFVAFILLCIGLQMMWTGWAELNGIAR